MKVRNCVVTFFILSMLAPAAIPASFHLIKIVELFPGSAAQREAQYVMLQMYSAGQTEVAGHSIDVFAANGSVAGSFTFASAVANGDNQDTILIATPQAEALFGVAADLAMAPVLDPVAGKVCFDDIDCVAWGNFGGSLVSPSPVGTPFSPVDGLLVGHAIVRDISKGNASLLQGGDDSDDSFDDFLCAATAEPINNAGASGTYTDPSPCPVCGNATTEFGELCDGADDALCPGGCLPDCSCPTHDAVVLPVKPVTVKVPLKDPFTVTKKIRVKVLNGDLGEKGNDSIRLTASSDCPAGVGLSTPDFAGAGDTVQVDPGRSATATVFVTVTEAAFTTFNRRAPGRCTLMFTAATQEPGNIDPEDSNNLATAELNVLDLNDAESTSPPHETVALSLKPLKVKIAAKGVPIVKKLRPSVLNADVLPAADAGDAISVAVDVSDCPGTSVVRLDMAKKVDGDQTSVSVDGGRKAKGEVRLQFDPALIDTRNEKSPRRCTAVFTATGPSDPDPDGSNNVTELVIDLYDKNDL